MKHPRHIFFLITTVFLTHIACISCTEGSTDEPITNEDITSTTFVVTFETNGGSFIDPQVVDNNTTATEPTPPTKDGYNFADWYSDANFIDSWNFENIITTDTLLYAKWNDINNDGYMAIRTLSDLKEFRDLVNNGNSDIIGVR